MPLGEGQRWLLPIVLVDAATGRVAAIRAVTLSPRVSRTLVDAIHEQARAPFDPATYDRALAAVYARHRSEDLARVAVMEAAGEDETHGTT